MSRVNKNEQLGMSYSTASARLVKDLLFKLIVDSGQDVCYRCGEKIARDEISVEHKVDWMYSGSPKELFFDLDNVTFSHMRCNSAAASAKRKLPLSPDERRKRKTAQALASKKKNYDPAKRRDQYLEHGH